MFKGKCIVLSFAMTKIGSDVLGKIKKALPKRFEVKVRPIPFTDVLELKALWEKDPAADGIKLSREDMKAWHDEENRMRRVEWRRIVTEVNSLPKRSEENPVHVTPKFAKTRFPRIL